MVKCFPQQSVHGMQGGAIQNWVFTVLKRGLRQKQCQVQITNKTLEEQAIDMEGCTEIEVEVPQRKRNIWVQLTDRDYRIRRIRLVRQGSGKVYFVAMNGGSQLYRQ